MKQQTVFVGLSGGVDSSVAALRLLREGYNVVGVFIKVWHPDFLPCNWEQERLDAMRVAAKLKIPFLTCDAEAAYKADVADYFIREYTAGRTPNPDVMCNKYVKFGTFLDFAKAHGADLIATGHYAQQKTVKDAKTGEVHHELHRGRDSNKDQSYFLWTLTPEQLSHTLFPVGNSKKETIRREAKVAGLLTATKADSQGICFLGQVDIPEFLSHYVDLIPGQVLDEAGTAIGTHRGALVYTLGQRHGFTVDTHDQARQPYYVVGRNLADNTVTVSTTKPTLSGEETICLTDVQLNTGATSLLQHASLQTRYRQAPVACSADDIKGDQLRLITHEPTDQPSVGQSCVLYSGARCLGGGIIASCPLPS